MCPWCIGIEKIICLMKHLDVRFTGMEHYLLAKARFIAVLKQYYPEWCREPGAGKTDSMEEHNFEERESEDGPSDEGGENATAECDSPQMSLEDLEPTLDACRECYGISAEHGSRLMYLVNGIILQKPVCCM